MLVLYPLEKYLHAFLNAFQARTRSNLFLTLNVKSLKLSIFQWFVAVLKGKYQQKEALKVSFYIE